MFSMIRRMFRVRPSRPRLQRRRTRRLAIEALEDRCTLSGFSKLLGGSLDENNLPSNKGSATVLNNVNGRFEKRFSNSNFVQCVDRDVGFFEAWVSVFDNVLNLKSELRTLAPAGKTECGTVPIQNRGDATNRGIASCFGASMTLCRRSGV